MDERQIILITQIYWTERDDGVMNSANKGTGEQLETILSSIYMPTDLTLVHPLRQPRDIHYTSPCQDKRCQHLCIVGRENGSASCYCPPSSNLQEDKMSCSSKISLIV